MTTNETIKNINEMLFGGKAFNRFTKEERDTLKNAQQALVDRENIEKLYERQKRRMREPRFQTHYNIGRLEALEDATGRTVKE